MEAREFERLKVSELKDFLKARGKRSTGNKAELIRLAKLFADDDVINQQVENETITTNIFNEPSLHWVDIAALHSRDFPADFDIDKVNEYLTTGLYNFDDEMIECGTIKPTVKGRKLYASGKVQLCECAQDEETNILFRSTIEASMKSAFRYPCVALDRQIGTVSSSSCTCECSDGKCSHVAALLYLLEDFSLGRELIIATPSTSKPQKWGHGSRVSKNPQEVHSKKYSKKRDPGRFIGIDPRPQHLQQTSLQELNFFLVEQQTFPHATMFQDRSLFYSDYEIMPCRKSILQEKTSQFLDNMKSSTSLLSLSHSNLSTPSGIHLDETKDQSGSDAWFQERQFRITASIFQDFHRNPSSTTYKMLWDKKRNLSSLPSIKWGVQNEATALDNFVAVTGEQISKCGLFVSRQFNWIGASPDGISTNQNFVVEVKCPYVLRNTSPFNLDSLTTKQQQSHFCVKDGDVLKLKTNHKYYWQCQLQMFVTGIHLTKFVV